MMHSSFIWRKKMKESYLPLKDPTLVKDNIKQAISLPWMTMWAVLLIIEVFIYSSYTILAHLCMIDGKLPFRGSSVVLCTETTKILMSVLMLAPEFLRGPVHLPSLSHSLLFLVPAGLYAINNNLSYYMQIHMDPTTYQILGNMKVGTTAILYRIIIKRKLSVLQWSSLAMLAMAGVFDSYGGIRKGDHSSNEIHLTMTGLLMMVVYCWISGLAGVYTEYILKDQYHISLHIQNILLYLFGIIINSSLWFIESSQNYDNKGSEQGLFTGFTFYTWMIIITQACNGLIMSAIMKHGSNITRLFIISCSMIVTTVLSVLIFNLALNLYYAGAFILVIIALYLWYHK